MRTRALLQRNNELVERNIQALERNSELFGEVREVMGEVREVMGEVREVMGEVGGVMGEVREEFRAARAAANESRDVMRALIAELRDHGDHLRRHTDATVGALSDLAAEIRGWRGEGPAAPA